MGKFLSCAVLPKVDLINALTGKCGSTLIVNGYRCYLQSIQREDGSGKSFNLSITYNGQPYCCYCRITD